jgi:hypothetical protein
VRKREELRDGYQRKTNEIFIAHEASHSYSMYVILVPACPLVVRHFENHATVDQTVKQII